MTAVADLSLAPSLPPEVARAFAIRRLRAIAAPVLIVAYLVYVALAFDIGGILGRLRPDNAAILLSDFWSYKTHVTRDNRTGDLSVAIEGEAKGTWPGGTTPDWVHPGPEPLIDLPGGTTIRYLPDAARIDVPGFGDILVRKDGRKIALSLPEGRTMPGWISASDSRVNLTGKGWRFSMTPNRTETFRYFPGWELFFFTLDSPFHDKSWGELAALALWEPRINPERSNIAAMMGDFWTNKMWRHGDVAWAIGETVLMAFLGTMGAGLLAFPLAFLAASNFTPFRALRLGLRRLFDFVRGVDGLIWTVILSRAFGPGPLTGSLAILMTDAGTFGKIFSETLENIDGRQVEGVASTGANAAQRARFGVLPQIAPVILSQLLYFLESNTRSATVIGALVGGGIGLLLTQAIITQKDWEEVSYYIVLIVLLVMVMDSISGWIRRRVIKG